MQNCWGTLHFVMRCDPKNALDHKTLKSDMLLWKKEGRKEGERDQYGHPSLNRVLKNYHFSSLWLCSCPWLLFCLCLHRDHSGPGNHGDSGTWSRWELFFQNLNMLVLGGDTQGIREGERRNLRWTGKVTKCLTHEWIVTSDPRHKHTFVVMSSSSLWPQS